jgi:Syntaxin-like protein
VFFWSLLIRFRGELKLSSWLACCWDVGYCITGGAPNNQDAGKSEAARPTSNVPPPGTTLTFQPRPRAATRLVNPQLQSDNMSGYNRSSALESQPTNWRREDDPAYADDPEFRRFTNELSDKLFQLTSTISRLSSQVGLLGTKKETERLRERVRDLIEEGSSGFKDAGEGLKKVLSWEDVGVSGW